MLLIKIITTLPLWFYVPVLVLTLLYLLWMGVQIVLTRNRVRQLQFELYTMEDSIRLHQGCHIENLPLISEIFETAPRKLAHAYEKMIQISIDFYQKKWIPNPGDFINLESVMDKNSVKKLKGFGFLYFSILGLLLAFLTVLTGFVFFNGKDQINAILVLVLITLCVDLFFTILFFVEKLQNSNVINSSIQALIQALSRKLPVFNDYNGVALLINQFLEYDRSMNQSVDLLSEKIERFAMDGLTEAVTTSIEKTLLESISPSIDRVTSAIVTLSQDVVEKEDNGMKDLAVKFSSSLSEELTYQLEPLVKQIVEVSNTLSNSKNYLDIASRILDEYKNNALELQSATSKTLVAFEETKTLFSNDVHAMADSIQDFSQASKVYNENVKVKQDEFNNAASSLKDSMENEQKLLRLLLDGIFVEARNAEEQALSSQKSNEAYLAVMKEQISQFSNEFSAHNNNLFSGLSTTLSEFFTRQSSQMSEQQDNIATQSIEMLKSMEKAASDIRTSTAQIKYAFDELEAARLREEEIAKNRKPGLFGHKR